MFLVSFFSWLAFILRKSSTIRRLRWLYEQKSLEIHLWRFGWKSPEYISGNLHQKALRKVSSFGLFYTRRWELKISIWRRPQGTVCWIEVKVAVLCAQQYMPWDLHMIKVLNNFSYFKHQILTRIYSEAYLKHYWRNCLQKL